MKKLTCLSAIILIMNLSVVRAGQSSDQRDDWASVRALASGTRVEVALKEGKKVEGDLLSVSDTNLTLTRKNQPVTINQSDIRSVKKLIPKSRKRSTGKSALLGAAIGFGIGAGTGFAVGSQEDFAMAETVAAFGLVGAGVGAVAGALKGSFSKYRRESVYEYR
jgi:hypothetical protein